MRDKRVKAGIIFLLLIIALMIIFRRDILLYFSDEVDGESLAWYIAAFIGTMTGVFLAVFVGQYAQIVNRRREAAANNYNMLRLLYEDMVYLVEGVKSQEISEIIENYKIVFNKTSNNVREADMVIMNEFLDSYYNVYHNKWLEYNSLQEKRDRLQLITKLDNTYIGEDTKSKLYTYVIEYGDINKKSTSIVNVDTEYSRKFSELLERLSKINEYYLITYKNYRMFQQDNVDVEFYYFKFFDNYFVKFIEFMIDNYEEEFDDPDVFLERFEILHQYILWFVVFRKEEYINHIFDTQSIKIIHNNKEIEIDPSECINMLDRIIYLYDKYSVHESVILHMVKVENAYYDRLISKIPDNDELNRAIALFEHDYEDDEDYRETKGRSIYLFEDEDSIKNRLFMVVYMIKKKLKDADFSIMSYFNKNLLGTEIIEYIMLQTLPPVDNMYETLIYIRNSTFFKYSYLTQFRSDLENVVYLDRDVLKILEDAMSKNKKDL